MKVKGDDVIEINSEHSHAPDQAKIEALMAKMDIIQRAAATQETRRRPLFSHNLWNMQKAKYKNCAQRICNLVRDYNNQNILTSVLGTIAQ